MKHQSIYRNALILTGALLSLFLISCTQSSQSPDSLTIQNPAVDANALPPGQTAPGQSAPQPALGQPGQVGQPSAQAGAVGEAVAGAPGTAQGTAQGTVPSPVITPYRTFITLENFVMENNGDPENPISNVRLEVVFPNGRKLDLPGNGQFWTISNGQMQDIKQTFEIPWEFVQKDGFNFRVQMVRKGSDLLPCNFDIRQLSQFNRKYICHTDVPWQLNQKTPENRIEKEGVEIRVFTDKNTPANQMPKDAIALR